jgi:DNA repair and recombination RAD54-like protein
MALSSDGDSTSEDDSSDDEGGPKAEFLPHEPLTVWEPSAEEATDGYVPLQVPPVLAQFLRPHQRAGVEFCCECLLGMREFEGNGCILADDMGLGKTLQSIATLYTMLRNGKRGPDVPLVRRAIVVCPCSLVNNWAQEFEKWYVVLCWTIVFGLCLCSRQ